MGTRRGSITATGEPTVADELRALIDEWASIGQLALTQFTATFKPADTDHPLWTPSQWTANSRQPAAPLH